MASGRFLSTSIAEDDRLGKLSMAAELLYLKTIPHLDRDGMISGKAGLLWGKICPLREELISEMQRAIDGWIQVGLVIRMMTEQGPVLFFPGFLKNNRLTHYDREHPSRYPAPPGYVRTDNGLVPVDAESPKKKSKAAQVPPLSNKNTEPVQDEVQDEVQDFRLQDQDQDQVEDKSISFPAEKVPSPQQEIFAAVCEAIGWDHKTLSKRDKGEVAQAVGILQKADYTVDDIRRFMTDVWFRDWRWTKEAQHPTLKQLRQEIGKVRSAIPGVAPPAKTKGISGFRDMLAQEGIEL